MRKEGGSIRDIASCLGVSRGSVSVWCSDIILSEEQINSLHEKMIRGSYRGRLLGSAIQKQKRIDKITLYEQEGFLTVGNITERELLMLFLGLYLGEGAKTGNCFQFVNSNTELIKIVIKCLKEIFNIHPNRIYCHILLNKLHETRKYFIEKEWSRVLDIPKKQFCKTIIIESKNKKIYENNKVYLGTLVLRVKRSSELQYKILGLAKGLISSAEKRIASNECM
jgi:hypothetical protein